MKPSILVIGSSNTDMVIKADHLPAAGETILGGVFFMNPGGKGANQAVAAARLGGRVGFIAKTGNDIFGRQSIQLFEEEGINTSYIISDPKHPSGVALITVDAKAENCIVVASGANATLNANDLQKARDYIREASIILMQLETPVEALEFVVGLMAGTQTRLVLNPAPVCPLSDALLGKISIITPNKKEAEMLTGIQITDDQSAENAARALIAKGVETVVITLGSRGALLFQGEAGRMITAPKVEAVDTTAAGDVFNGALVVALSEGKEMEDAVSFACRASAISVTRLGAQSSAPFRKELDAFTGK
ncbi:ribokinase [Flavitalea flava]